MSRARATRSAGHLFLFALVVLAACGGGDDRARSERPDATPRTDGATAAESTASTRMVPLYTVGEPLQEIGEFEGGGDQTLDYVADVTMIGDDRIAVVDQMAADVLVYDTIGALTATFGGEGDGPGEFRSPSDIRVLPGDSIRILDSRDQRATVLTGEFEYVREAPAVQPLVGRFVLYGVITEAERARVLDALEGHPYPMSEAGVRIAALTDDGTVWVREPLGSDGDPTHWTVLGPDGTPARAVTLPERFEPMYMRGDDVAGRWRGELDVHYVRRYTLEASDRVVPVPSWMGRQPEETSEVPPIPDATASFMRAVLRNFATEQEIHYSTEYSYTADLDPLGRYEPDEVPDGLAVDILYADGRGWAAIMTVAGHSGLCSMTYGAVTLPGLRPGLLQCIG